MKTYIPVQISLLLVLLPLTIYSQDMEPVSIPLSNPGEPGTLHVGLVMGSVTVTAGNSDEVQFTYSGAGEGDFGIGNLIGNVMSGLFNHEDDDSTESDREGLTRIPNPTLGIDATERANSVNINVPPTGGSVKLDITVPENFSLNLSTVNGGDIIVEGISGKHELSNVNGRIVMTDVKGSAVVNTVNGNIVVVFSEVTENAPMSFTTVNGDIDLSVPGNTGFNVRMRSEWGEIYSDFDMALNRASVNRESEQSSDTYKVSIDQWVTGSVNNGGPEWVFRTLHGDIMIRRR